MSTWTSPGRCPERHRGEASISLLEPVASQIQAAFVYGSVAEDRLRRSVNPTICTGREFAQRRNVGSAFIARVLERRRIWLIGDEDALTA